MEESDLAWVLILAALIWVAAVTLIFWLLNNRR
jgi:hypothetical protein